MIPSPQWPHKSLGGEASDMWWGFSAQLLGHAVLFLSSLVPRDVCLLATLSSLVGQNPSWPLQMEVLWRCTQNYSLAFTHSRYLFQGDGQDVEQRLCNAWKDFTVLFMILKNWKHLKCLTLGCLITANAYLWENNLVQDRVRDVRLEAQAAKLSVDFGPTVFLRGCTDTQLENGLEGNIPTFFQKTEFHF